MLQNKDGKNISFSSVKVIVTSSFSFGKAVNHWEKKYNWMHKTTKTTQRKNSFSLRWLGERIIGYVLIAPNKFSKHFLFVLRDKV